MTKSKKEVKNLTVKDLESDIAIMQSKRNGIERVMLSAYLKWRTEHDFRHPSQDSKDPLEHLFGALEYEYEIKHGFKFIGK